MHSRSRVKSERLRQFAGSPFHSETSSVGDDWMMDRTSPRVEITRSNQPSRGAEDQEDVKYSTPVSLETGEERRSFIRPPPVHRRGIGYRPYHMTRQRVRLRDIIEAERDEETKKRRSFCRSWCEMWFLLAQSKITCIGLSAVLFIGGALLILLAALGGLAHCSHLTGAVVFCVLMGILSISLGMLCCCYHWVQDDDDIPFAIFCVAYCLLILFMSVTVAGTVVVFTRIHPIGPNQPPPGVPTVPTVGLNGTSLEGSSSLCGMTELPLGILVICYCLSIVFVMMAYFACILALGATSGVDNH